MGALIHIENMKKIYNPGENEVRALDGIDLDIEKGDLVAIVGHSGSGKSTLMNMLGCLDTPTSGKYVLDGQDVASMTDNQLADVRNKEIGFIFQGFNLISNLDAVGNVELPLVYRGVSKNERKQLAMEALKSVGLEERMKAYPAQLSGGQKQRVAIARAMSTNPKVLLCDEATSALDPNTTKSILELLKKINRELGITVIVITHEMAVIESICDRVAIIDHSHIAESGKVSEIFSGPKSEIGRQLILGETAGQKTSFARARQIRVIFNGQESSEPIISNMVLACKVPVNILLADTHDIGGKAMGQMLLQLPEDEVDAGRICNYLKTVGVTYEEVR